MWTKEDYQKELKKSEDRIKEYEFIRDSKCDRYIKNPKKFNEKIQKWHIIATALRIAVKNEKGFESDGY